MGRVSTWEVHGTWARTHSSVAEARVIKQYMTQLIFCPAMECPEEKIITAKARAASEEDGQHQHGLSLQNTRLGRSWGTGLLARKPKAPVLHERKAGSE